MGNNTSSSMDYMNCPVDDDLNINVGYTDTVSGVSTNADYIDDASGTITVETPAISCWDYWHNHYYPQVIHESYPVYVRERSLDKGKKAFEIIKILKDKRLVRLDKVSDFIDLMDELIKIL